MLKLEQAHSRFINYLNEKDRAEATITAYSKDIQQLINHIKEQGLAEIDRVQANHIKGFMSKLKEKGYTPKSISRKTNSTKTFFKFLHEEAQVIDNNPANLVSHPKVKPKAPRILSKIEYKALRDVVRDDVRASAIVEILIQTGIRISELSKIKLEHLELGEEGEQGSLYVPKRGKTPERNIPLNGSVQKAIKEYMEIRPHSNKSFLFVTKTGNRLLVRNIRATLDRYFEEIGLEDVKVNDLRHTFIAHHLKQGAPLYMVSKVAGHKRISTTERYLDYIEVEQEKDNFKLKEL